MRRPLSSLVIVFTASFLLTGCPGSSSKGAPSTSNTQASPAPGETTTQAAAAPASVGQVYEVQDSPATRGALVQWTRDAELDPVLRLGALRRLEELGADETTSLAAELARSEDRLLRENAVAVLSRSDAPEARRALADLGPDAQALAKVLQGGGAR